MSEPCRHEYGDAITSFVVQTKALTAMTAERDAALAALARVAVLCDALETNPHAALVVDRIRAALEPTQHPDRKASL